MFSEFSAAARAVFKLAEQECRNTNHYYLGTEHLLLAMAVAPPPDVAAFFRDGGVEPWQVKEALRAAMDAPYDRLWEGIIVTPRVKQICARAAASRRGESVEPADLLRAIIDDGGGIAARVLDDVRSAPADVRRAPADKPA